MTERPFWESFRVVAKCTEMTLVKPKFSGMNGALNRERWDTMLAAGNITALADIAKSSWKILRADCIQYNKALKRQRLSARTKKLLIVLLLSETLDQNLFEFIVDPDHTLSEEYILELMELGPRLDAWQTLADQLIT